MPNLSYSAFPVLSLAIWCPVFFGLLVLVTGKDERALFVRWLSLLGAAVITVCDGCSFMNAIYETISALCTVGLTTGITPTLCTASKLILIVFMFFGRVGIMTIGVGFMMGDRAKERVQYAQTKVMIG